MSVFLVGRIIVGAYFLYTAYSHLVNGEQLMSYAAWKGVPYPKAVVYAWGALILMGGLSVILGYRPVWGILMILVYMISFTLVMHNYWQETDPAAMLNEKAMFQKNAAIIGLLIMSLSLAIPWEYSL